MKTYNPNNAPAPHADPDAARRWEIEQDRRRTRDTLARAQRQIDEDRNRKGKQP